MCPCAMAATFVVDDRVDTAVATKAMFVVRSSRVGLKFKGSMLISPHAASQQRVIKNGRLR